MLPRRKLFLRCGELREERQSVPQGFACFFSSRRRHTICLSDWSSDVCSSDLTIGDPFINPSLRNFSPRLGFAWDVKGDGKTAVRGGFGLLYDILTDMGTVMTNGICAPPVCSSSSATVAVGTVLTFPLSFSAAGKSLRD